MKMKATASFTLILLLCASCATREQTTSDEPDWEEVAKQLQQQDPKQVERTMLCTAEATAFFALLARGGHLPATPANIVDTFVVAPWPPTFSAKHPVTMRVEVELKDKTTGKQQYTIRQESKDTPWLMTEGWSIVNDSRSEKLPLPSDDIQKAISAAARESMKEEQKTD